MVKPRKLGDRFYRYFSIDPDPSYELDLLIRSGIWKKDDIIFLVNTEAPKALIRRLLMDLRPFHQCPDYHYLKHKSHEEAEAKCGRWHYKEYRVCMIPVDLKESLIFDMYMYIEPQRRKRLDHAENELGGATYIMSKLKYEWQECPECSKSIYGSCSAECYNKVFPHANLPVPRYKSRKRKKRQLAKIVDYSDTPIVTLPPA